MTCYVCGIQTNRIDANKTPLCFKCSPPPPVEAVQTSFEFSGDEPVTEPLFQGIGDLISLDDINYTQITDERLALLEALYDELRTIREHLVPYPKRAGYFVTDLEMVEVFNLLDQLENL